MATFLLLSLTFLFPLRVVASTPVCENHLNCPPGLAQLQGPKNVCTAFLIESNRVATNRHCLPPEMQKSGADCSSLKIVFPKTIDLPSLEAKCQYIEKLGPKMQSTLAPDVALLRLEHSVNRNPLPLSLNSGLKHGEFVTIFKINPAQGAEAPQAEKIECSAIQKSMLNPYFDSADSAVFSFYPCKVIKGNSGSPVLNDNGEVIAVINSKTQLNLKDDLPYLSHLSGDAAFATHIRCVQAPDSCDGEFNDEEASKRYKKMETEVYKKLETEFREKAVITEKELFEKSGKILRWSLKETRISDADKESGILARYQFKPYCVNISVHSIHKNKDKLSKKSQTKDYLVYELIVSMKFNEQLNLTSDIQKKEGTSKVSLIPAELLLPKLPIQFVAMNQRSPEYLSLPYCP